jgi:hypothetical protein
MADRWAVATGNWSSTATWNGGTLPTAADDVFADGFTVTIDQDVTVLSIRTTQRSGGTNGGTFNCSTSRNIIGNIVSGKGTGLTFSAASPAILNITGSIIVTALGNDNSFLNCKGLVVTSTGTVNIIGSASASGSNNNAHAIDLNGSSVLNLTGSVYGAGSGNYGILMSGSSIVSITGNVYAGSNLNGHGIQMSSFGSLTVNGNVYGAYQGTAYGINATSTTTIIINGTVDGGGTAGNNAPGHAVVTSGALTIIGNIIGGLSTSNNSIGVVCSGTTVISGNITANGSVGVSVVGGAITINGNITGGSFASGLISTTSSTVLHNGNSTASSNGFCGLVATKSLIKSTDIVQHTYRVNSSGSPGIARSLYTGGQNLGQPSGIHVRAGHTYGVSNEFVGTLIVPSAQFVSLGTPVDSGVGSLQYLSSSDLQAALAPNSPVMAQRSDDDTKALTFSWPASGASIIGQKSIDNAAYVPVSGAISYLRTENARHYYTLAYSPFDRTTQESTIRYKMDDGTYTKYFNLRIMPSTNAEVIAIKAKTDNLPPDPASASDITSLQNNAPMEAF